MTQTGARILATIRPQARRLALWTEHLWQTGQTSPDQGPAIGPAEVARLLAADETRTAESEFYAARTGGLDAAADEAASALGTDPVWRDVVARFALDREEADFLALLLAVELDPALARVVAYLHDDGRATQPTPWLSARLNRRPAMPFFGANLRRWLLAAAEPASEQLGAPWRADRTLTHAIATGDWRDPAMKSAATLVYPDSARSLPRLHPDALASLEAAFDPRDLELTGAPGIGKCTVAAQFAAGRGQSLLAVDLSQASNQIASIVYALREAAMTGALVYFSEAQAAQEADWARARALDVPFLRGTRHPTGDAQSITLAPLAIGARINLWRELTTAPAPQSLVAHRFTPREIAAAARNDTAPIRTRSRRPDHTLLNSLPLPYAWSDLVVSADIADQLHAFETQVRLRWSVYEDWGFARLTHLGQGISALFGGPSGTGKTMAAQVLARSLGLDLLRVDLAGVVNKYVGETEKKLREVFDACEDSGAVLFFDEADALFGHRTQVKDAHDRFANIEIDYLLQRIERFDGVTILATNRRQDLDPAFVRRLNFVVEFLPPRPAERLALWHHALPACAPNGERICDDIDWTYLSERLVMTGAEIKSITLGAAFLARDQGIRIGMRQILIAAQREMAKQGQRIRIPLAEAGE
jgi:ATPase family associated with various cellular activities (AAA)